MLPNIREKPSESVKPQEKRPSVGVASHASDDWQLMKREEGDTHEWDFE